MTQNKQTDPVGGRPSEDTNRPGSADSARDITMGYDPTEKTIIFRFRGQSELTRRQSTVATHYFDSLEWMKTALLKDNESGRSLKHTPIDASALKVGQVCCGFAIEFAYKALLYSQDKPHTKKMESHHVSKLHEMVDQPDRAAIEAVGEELLRVGNSSVTPRNGIELIKYIADHYTNPDVKYWGRRASARSGTVMPGIPSRSDENFGSIASIQKIHCKILDLARRRTWPYNWARIQADASQSGANQYSKNWLIREDADDPLPEELWEQLWNEQLVALFESRGINVPPEFYQDDLSDNR